VPSHPFQPLELYRGLADAHVLGSTWPDGDWPVRGGFLPAPFEIVLGAVLTQNTRWANVEATLGRLLRRGLNTPRSILQASQAELEDAVRPAGFFRRKAATILRVARLLEESWDPTPKRADLLALRGIGPETADAILLYAFERPEFVVDAYTRRLLARLGLIGSGDDYDRVRVRIEAGLPRDVRLYKTFHALIVEHGKHICRRRPRCGECVLRARCPAAPAAGKWGKGDG
jgi:endonuclease III related protein